MTKEGDYDPDENVTITTVTGIDVDTDTISWSGGSLVVPDATDYSYGDTITVTGGTDTWFTNGNTISFDPTPSDYRIGDVTVTANQKPDITRDSDPEGLFERVERIERAIGITQRNRKLEEQYPDLEQAGKDYEAAIDAALGNVQRRLAEATAKYTRAADECDIMEKLKLNNEPEE